MVTVEESPATTLPAMSSTETCTGLSVVPVEVPAGCCENANWEATLTIGLDSDTEPLLALAGAATALRLYADNSTRFSSGSTCDADGATRRFVAIFARC